MGIPIRGIYPGMEMPVHGSDLHCTHLDSCGISIPGMGIPIPRLGSSIPRNGDSYSQGWKFLFQFGMGISILGISITIRMGMGYYGMG